MFSRYIRFALPGILLLVSVAAAHPEKPNRIVKRNVLVSDALPKIKIAVKGKFKYVGRFDFKIRDVAAGERFVFVDASNGKVNKMFIAQFEGFLPHIDDYYRYSFRNAMQFGTHRFRQNTYAYSNAESRRSNPNGEGVLTEDFLKKRGYTLQDELMMSRFITVPDRAKKHELILYYLENVSRTRHSLAEFYKDDKATDVWQQISIGLKARSLKSFKIK